MALECALDLGLTSVAWTECKEEEKEDAYMQWSKTYGHGLFGPLIVQRTGDFEDGSR